MSQLTKRDATEAFGNDETASPVSQKHTRRKTRHKGPKATVAVQSTITSHSEPSSASTLVVRKTGLSKSATDPDIWMQNAPARDDDLIKGPQHKRQPKNVGSHSTGKTGLDPASVVSKSTYKDRTKNRSKGAKGVTTPRGRVKSFAYPKSTWTESIFGGYFLDQDPVLSPDEQYFLLPTTSHVHIYSATTSLLVRSLFISLVDSVTSCIVAPSNPEQVLVSTYTGTIVKYNWRTGGKLQKWKTKPALLRIYGLPASKADDNDDTVLAINQRSGEKRDLSRLCLSVLPDVKVKKLVVRRKQKIASTTITLNNGKVIISFAEERVIFGTSQDPVSGGYAWQDFTMPSKIVSLDARIRTVSTTTLKVASAVDVAVGLQDGAIIIVEDILARLTQFDKSIKDIDKTYRRLHWHRDAVCAIKWSRDGAWCISPCPFLSLSLPLASHSIQLRILFVPDPWSSLGNYLISGGHETVLVIWQLDTNQRQYLPHLSTSICNIVVSSSGSSYTLMLGDNSIIMLSTNDLVAKANIRCLSVSTELCRKVVAATNPRQPDQISLVTPSDTCVGAQSTFTTLQTFNLATDHEVSQQALVRNLATAVNVSPHGQRILNPDVVQLQISHDGLWLATVDEWTPPDTDLEPLDLHVDSTISARKTEVYLKFWSFQNESKTWEMSTKVEGPHSAIPQSVLRTAFNPARVEFASAGRDGYLRIWRPKVRQRDGMSVKDKAGKGLYTWACHHEQRPNPPRQPIEAESAALAYSEDGSAIAISFMYTGLSRVLQIVDSRTGTINSRGTEVHVCPLGNVEMTFSWKRLLMLSDKLVVWDVVDSMLACDPMSLKAPYIQDNGRFLAANNFDHTFAIAMNPPDRRKPAHAVIFDANRNRPVEIIHVGEIQGHVKALVAAIKSPGYIVIDGQARIRRLRPGDSAVGDWKVTTVEDEEPMKNLKDVFGSGSKNDVVHARPTIRSAGRANRTLEDVIEESATSAKPMLPSQLFAAVADLFKKRPDSGNKAEVEIGPDSQLVSQ